MSKKPTIEFSDDADDILKRIVMDAIAKNGLDVQCPKCGESIHLSFSGDSCKFCGLVIEFGTEPDI